MGQNTVERGNKAVLGYLLSQHRHAQGNSYVLKSCQNGYLWASCNGLCDIWLSYFVSKRLSRWMA